MKISLLIVDDEPAICKMLSTHFKLLGYDVATAENGVAALEYMGHNKIDILVSDLLMPEMDGMELTTRVREEYPLVRMIVVTGYVTLHNAMECMQNGADALIPKPITDMGKLEHAVSRSAEILQGWIDHLSELQLGHGGKNG